MSDWTTRPAQDARTAVSCVDDATHRTEPRSGPVRVLRPVREVRKCGPESRAPDSGLRTAARLTSLSCYRAVYSRIYTLKVRRITTLMYIVYCT